MSPRRIALLAGVALALAACAGDDDATDTTVGGATDPPPTTAAGTTAGTAAAPGSAAAPATSATTAATIAASAPTSAVPSGPPAVTLTEVVSLENPVDLAWREGDDALYVVEQDGRVQRLAGDGGEATTVLDVTDLTSAEGERGLLGLAFAAAGDVAYIDYTDNDGNTVVAEHPVDDDGTFRAGDEARTVLQIEQPYPNHNGGDLTFGPDGLLYIGTGDGGSGGDPERRASDRASMLGKLLRIDPAIGPASGGQPYTVPADNPFVGVADSAPEVWAFGLRNPWRFSFDAATGDLWIADVGQSEFEEVDVAPAADGQSAGRGLNFGWSAFEGMAPYNDDVPTDGATPPVYTYSHDEGCSISGGVRVRGDAVPGLDGWYVFTDYCAGALWALPVSGEGASIAVGERVTLADGIDSPTAVVSGPDGAVYVLSGGGPVLRVDPAGEG